MKKKRNFYDKQLFHIHIGVYQTDITVAINMDEKEVLKGLKKVIMPKFQKEVEERVPGWDEAVKGTTLGRTIQIGGGFLVLLTADKLGFRRFVGTVTHEMFHVTSGLMGRKGMELTPDTDEAYAYLIEHLVGRTLSNCYT